VIIYTLLIFMIDLKYTKMQILEKKAYFYLQNRLQHEFPLNFSEVRFRTSTRFE